MSYGHIKDDEFRIILNDHALLLLAIVFFEKFCVYKLKRNQ